MRNEDQRIQKNICILTQLPTDHTSTFEYLWLYGDSESAWREICELPDPNPLFQRMKQAVRVFQRRFGASWSPLDHSDLFNELFCRLAEKFEHVRFEYKEGAGKFEKWLVGVLVNLLRTSTDPRSNQNRWLPHDSDQTGRLLVETLPGSPIVADNIQRKAWKIMKQEIAKLPKWKQRIIRLSYFGKWKQADIAAKVGTSTGTVSTVVDAWTKSVESRLRDLAAEFFSPHRTRRDGFSRSEKNTIIN